MRRPQHSPHDAVTPSEGDTPSDTTPSATERVGGEDATITKRKIETVLLPSRAPRENKFHRPGAQGSPLPACGTFDSTGVEANRAEVRDRGYRPCRLCWLDAATVDAERGDGK